jgi:hypothetical protein
MPKNLTNTSIESPEQLGERYRRELRDLVDLEEISPRAAQRILDDLFETNATDGVPRLRWRVWTAYVEELSRGAEHGRFRFNQPS